MLGGPDGVDARVRRYGLFVGLWSFELWHPFWTLWLLSAPGVNYLNATLVDIVFWAVSILVAMPAGALADRIGRKPSLLLGILMWNAGIVVFGLARSLPVFAIANATWAFGAMFLFSSGPAYLYDTLAEAGQEARYPKVVSRVAMVGFLSTAAGCGVGGLVVRATGSLQAVLLLNVVNGVLAAATVLTFREPDVARRPESGTFAQIGAGLRATRKSRQIPLLILFQVLTGIVLYVLAFFRAPLVESIVGQDYVLIGLVFGGFFGVASVAGMSVGRVLERLGETGTLALTYLFVYPPFVLIYLASVGTFAAGVAAALAILAQIPSYIIWGLETPVVTTIINRRVGASERATVLSVSMFFTTLSLGVTEPIVGYLANLYDLGPGLSILAVIAAIPTALVLAAYRRSEREAPLPAAPILPHRGP
ncbi:MAG: MFS transporter [Methanobacteriota archaeon]